MINPNIGSQTQGLFGPVWQILWGFRGYSPPISSDFYRQTFLKTIPSHCQFWRTWMLFLTPFPTKTVLVTKMWCSHMVQIWDPMLGLIIDVQAPQATFLAAALLWVWVLRFVYLVFPIRLYNDHKYSSPPSTKTSRDEWLLLGACLFSRKPACRVLPG